MGLKKKKKKKVTYLYVFIWLHAHLPPSCITKLGWGGGLGGGVGGGGGGGGGCWGEGFVMSDLSFIRYPDFLFRPDDTTAPGVKKK